MRLSWSPALGANRFGSAVRFRVFAPAANEVRLHLEGRGEQAMTPEGDGLFVHEAEDVAPGQRYGYRLDGQDVWPDPWSRSQPDGVHGLSAVVDPSAFAWRDAGWRGVPRQHLVIYELHVGTFTPEGTFAAATARLPWLRDLGVTAVELMPVASFPGRHNWGYDGAALSAPAAAYGTPDDLRRLVDEAHALGLAVLQDVVYNHLGPDGAYLAAFVPTVLTTRHTSSWGQGINLDGPGSTWVRRTFLDNALSWLVEYHMDGLRLDATHALIDEGPEHWLAALARETRSLLEHTRPVHLFAEDDRNLARLVQSPDLGGYGLDGIWADDFHHVVRRRVAGDREAYFQDFEGTTEELATVLRQGWLYTGQRSSYRGEPRGGPADGVPLPGCVICIQNHDQIGNRAFGERLHHQVGHDTWLTVSTLLLMAPETPLLFMGQEWSASTPFLFFTDHSEALGKLVTEGRRAEFKAFSAFDAASSRAAIPDPQAQRTFRASVLDWDEIERPAHERTVRAYRQLLALRRRLLFDAPRTADTVQTRAIDADTLALEQPTADGGRMLLLASLGKGPVTIDVTPWHGGERWQVAFDSRDGAARWPSPEAGRAVLALEAPCAVVLHATDGGRQ